MSKKNILCDTNILRRKKYLYELKLNNENHYISYFSCFELLDTLVMNENNIFPNKLSIEEENYIIYIIRKIWNDEILILGPKNSKYKIAHEVKCLGKITEYKKIRNFLLEDVSFVISQFLAIILLYVLIGVANSIIITPKCLWYQKFKLNLNSKKLYDKLYYEIRETFERSYLLEIKFRKEFEKYCKKKIIQLIEDYNNENLNKITISNDLNYNQILSMIYKKDKLQIGDSSIENDFIYYFCYSYSKQTLENGKKIDYNDVIDILNMYYAYKYKYYYMTNDNRSVKMVKKYIGGIDSIKEFINSKILII